MGNPEGRRSDRSFERGAVAVGILAAVVAGFVGGLLGVVVGVSLPGRLAPEATHNVSQVVTDYDAK